MSTLLSGFDLIKLEENLRKEVSERFGKVVWDSKELVGSNAYEMDYGAWSKMMSVGHTPTTRSTRSTRTRQTNESRSKNNNKNKKNNHLRQT